MIIPIKDPLLALAPPTPELAPGLSWHVFISYRASERSWVLKLYEVLARLGYKVFLDQLSISFGGDLATQLSTALASSAAGILVWSGISADSEWLKAEYSAMSTRSVSGNFRYVVANRDISQPPLFASTAIWVDFSDAAEGPSGIGLLRVLWGLQGKTVPPQAARAAQEIDDRTRKTLMRIRALQQVGDAEEILRLARTFDPSLTWAELLPCAAAEALLRLGRYAESVSILRPLQDQYPSSLRIGQLLATALHRHGEFDEARTILAHLYELGSRDAETLGLYARICMQQYRSHGKSVDLEMAQSLYREGFDRFPNDYYLGINAASTSILLGSVEDAHRFAERVVDIIDETPRRDFWLQVTRAEAELILGRYKSAANAYRLAVETNPTALGSHVSTWMQATKLMESLGASSDERDKIALALGQSNLTG